MAFWHRRGYNRSLKACTRAEAGLWPQEATTSTLAWLGAETVWRRTLLEDMKALVRGGGDLASGVVYRLRRVGMQVMVVELPQPTVIRRAVAFASALYEGVVEIEGIVGRRVESLEQAL
jgi:hypothetical protein